MNKPKYIHGLQKKLIFTIDEPISMKRQNRLFMGFVAFFNILKTLLFRGQSVVNIFDLSDYILQRQNPEELEITVTKLNKLLYYSQGTFLATTGKELFAEEIEAWPYGPVVPSVYKQYKSDINKGMPIIPPTKEISLHLTSDAIELLEETLTYFGQYSATHLTEMTHSETPWINAYNQGEGTIIPKTVLQDYFKAEILKS